MTDLTEYDREIVAAAERCAEGVMSLKDWHERTQFSVSGCLNDLIDAIQAKRDALRPRCTVSTCTNLAVQQCVDLHSTCQFFRCEAHSIKVREL